jgi:hypothetical protein
MRSSLLAGRESDCLRHQLSLIAYILKHYFFAETTGLQQKV